MFFPVVSEPAHIQELRSIVPFTHQHSKRPACIDRGELRPVADQQHLRTDRFRVGGDRVEGEGSCEGCFVDDDELTPA